MDVLIIAVTFGIVVYVAAGRRQYRNLREGSSDLGKPQGDVPGGNPIHHRDYSPLDD